MDDEEIGSLKILSGLPAQGVERSALQDEATISVGAVSLDEVLIGV